MATRKVSTSRGTTPTGPYHQLVKAIRAAGATELCRACFCWVMPGHSECPDWSVLGLPTFSAPAAVLVLDGGLEEEPVSDMTTEERAAFVDEHDAQMEEVA